MGGGWGCGLSARLLDETDLTSKSAEIWKINWTPLSSVGRATAVIKTKAISAKPYFAIFQSFVKILILSCNCMKSVVLQSTVCYLIKEQTNFVMIFNYTIFSWFLILYLLFWGFILAYWDLNSTNFFTVSLKIECLYKLSDGTPIQ